MTKIGKIQNIDPEQDNTWKNKIFLTFDLDWAIDSVIHFVLDILEQHEIGATFFVTHQSKIVERIRSNSLHEVGIHPNFNGLIDSTKSGSYRKIIDELLDAVGPVKIVRSHSLFQSSHILEYFFKTGITHDCNLYVPSEINLKPWYHWNGMIRVPHSWEDDINFISSLDVPPHSLLNRDSLCVVDFHPVHVFLNTPNYEYYLKCRPHLKDFDFLKSNINTALPGVRDHFLNLIDYIVGAA